MIFLHKDRLIVQGIGVKEMSKLNYKVAIITGGNSHVALGSHAEDSVIFFY